MKKKELLKRIEVLEAIVNATNDKVVIVDTWQFPVNEVKKGKLTIVVSEDFIKLHAINSKYKNGHFILNKNIISCINKSINEGANVTLYTDKNDTENFRKWFGKFVIHVMDEKPKNGWYKSTIPMHKKYLAYHDYENNHSFGIGTYGHWINDKNTDFPACIVPATPEEVEQRLKEEAVKRGFKKGATINNFILGFENTNYLINEDTFQYYETEIGVGGFKIMKNGVWARIVEDTKPQFKPVYMECTKEQFERMKPKLESIGFEIGQIEDLENQPVIFNCKDHTKKISNVLHSRREDYCAKRVNTEAEFLEACGYVKDTKPNFFQELESLMEKHNAVFGINKYRKPYTTKKGLAITVSFNNEGFEYLRNRIEVEKDLK